MVLTITRDTQIRREGRVLLTILDYKRLFMVESSKLAQNLPPVLHLGVGVFPCPVQLCIPPLPLPAPLGRSVLMPDPGIGQ